MDERAAPARRVDQTTADTNTPLGGTVEPVDRAAIAIRIAEYQAYRTTASLWGKGIGDSGDDFFFVYWFRIVRITGEYKQTCKQ